MVNQKAIIGWLIICPMLAWGSELDLFITGPRQLELEPCGCSLAPKGGVAREFNFYSDRRKKQGKEAKEILVTVGATFFTNAQNESGTTKAFYRRKAMAMVDSLNALGTSFLALSPEDLSLPKAHLSAWKKKSKFVWLASNVVGPDRKPAFSSSYQRQVGPAGISFLSFISPDAVSNSAWQVENPAEAAKRILESEVNNKPLFHVLVSYLNSSDLDAVSKIIPDIVVLINNDQVTEDESTITLEGGRILAKPGHSFRPILHLTFPELKPVFQGLYGRDYVEELSKSLSNWTEALEKKKKSLLVDMSSSERLRLQQEVKSVEETIQTLQLKLNNVTDKEKALVFWNETEVLYSRYDLPRNKLHQIVNRFKQKTHSIALGE